MRRKISKHDNKHKMKKGCKLYPQFLILSKIYALLITNKFKVHAELFTLGHVRTIYIRCHANLRVTDLSANKMPPMER